MNNEPITTSAQNEVARPRVGTPEYKALMAADARERYWNRGGKEAKKRYYRNSRAALIHERYMQNRVEILAKLQAERDAKKKPAANETAPNKI